MANTDVFAVGAPAVVSAGKTYTDCKVTKVARRYLTVQSPRGVSWEFDKVTRRHRGEHGGYIPHLYTPAEYELHQEWVSLLVAARALPFTSPKGARVEQVRAARVAIEEAKGDG